MTVSRPALRSVPRSVIDRAGAIPIELVRGTFGVAATAAAVLLQAARLPRGWPRTVRAAFAEQVHRLGVGSAGLVCGVGFLVGTLLVAEYQTWVGAVIESKYLAALVVAVVFREVGPLLVNILLIARGGAAVAVELGLMTALGEVRALDAQGLDPLGYLLVPRVCGLALSGACLTVFFLAASLAGVYACGQWVGAKTGAPLDLAEQILLSLSARDVVGLASKATVAPWVAATICCVEGLRADRDVVSVPGRTARAVQRAIIVVVLLSAAVSWITYA